MSFLISKIFINRKKNDKPKFNSHQSTNTNDEFIITLQDNRTTLNELGYDIKIPRNNKIKLKYRINEPSTPL